MTSHHTADPVVAELLGVLQTGRDALLWKLEGLDEYELRRPRTPTGTNLLGVLQHVSSVEHGYLTTCLGRPQTVATPWLDDDAPDNADMWVDPSTPAVEVVRRAREMWAADDAVVTELGADGRGIVPWWGNRDVTVHRLLVHMIAELQRHLGQIDILREQSDGEVGMRDGGSNLPEHDAEWWRAHIAEIEAAAREAAARETAQIEAAGTDTQRR